LRFIETPLRGAFVIECEAREDERGSFGRLFCEREFEAEGLETRFPQWSLSRNLKAGTLRGLHFNAAPHEEIKLVRCTAGAIADMIVDVRPRSPTFCRWHRVDLNAASGRALYVPKGFAHGFQTLTEGCDVMYHISAFHEPEAARGVRWNDPAFAIVWPQAEARIMSERDLAYPDFVP
jgi:dTDP-4-dehydrorhamnose 3,5-epimerase